MLLTDEENPYIDKPETGSFERQVFFRGGQAQLKKVVEWINEPCNEHTKNLIPRRRCGDCMEALLKEIE